MAHQELRSRLLLWLPAALAATTGTVTLGSKGFTSDESVSVTLARLPWHQFGGVVVHRETNGSLYFTLLHVFTGGKGGEWGVRVLSLAAFVVATAVFALLVRRLFDVRTAAIAGVLFALNPLHVEYAQTAREYLLALLLVVCSTYLFVRGVQEPSPLVWTAYAVASAAASYAFLLAAAVPVAHALSLAALPRARVPWRLAVRGLVGFAVLLLPLVFSLTETKASGGVAWASGNLPGRIAVSARDQFPRALLVVLLAGLSVVLATVWWRIAGRYPWPAVLMVAWLVVPAYLVTVAALVWQPLFIVRYFMIFAPPVIVVAAVILRRLRGPTLGVAAAIVLVVAVYGLARWYHSGGADYRGASAYVSRRRPAGRRGSVLCALRPASLRALLPGDQSRTRRPGPRRLSGEPVGPGSRAVHRGRFDAGGADPRSGRRVPPNLARALAISLIWRQRPGLRSRSGGPRGERIPARAKTLFCRRCSAPIRPVRTP